MTTASYSHICVAAMLGFLLVLAGCQGTAVLDDDSTGDDDDTAGDDDISDDDISDDDAADDDSAEPTNFALGFEGAESGETTETTATTTPTPGFAVELWVQRTGPLEGFFIDTRRQSGSNWSLFHRAGHTTFSCPAETGQAQFLYGIDLNDLDDRWHHVAVAVAENATMFIDGIEVASQAWTPCEIDSAAVIHLGSRYEGDEMLHGATVDEIRISTTVRYSGTFAPDAAFTPDGETELLWHFDEGQGQVATDEVLGLDITLENPAWIEGAN